MRWWEAPEWGKPQIMKFPDLRGKPMRRAADVVEDDKVHKVYIFVSRADTCWRP